MSEDVAVSVLHLVKRYGARAALDGLSLSVDRGQIFALLGPNGAGKTTAIEICEGFRRPDSGTVRILGLDPIADAARLRPRVGVMLQEGLGGYTGARVGELLSLFASFARAPLPAGPLLELLGLAGASGTLVKRLSGGQKQRLSLALALIGRPELVFLDEPTAGMDPQARRGAWELIGRLKSDGVTVVMSTHLLDEAETLADTVVVIDAGAVLATGSPAELTRAGAEGQVRFSGPTGLAVQALTSALPTGSQATEREPGRYLVTGEVTPQLLAALTGWCAQQGVFAQDLAVQRRSLEDVFLELTGHGIRA